MERTIRRKLENIKATTSSLSVRHHQPPLGQISLTLAKKQQGISQLIVEGCENTERSEGENRTSGVPAIGKQAKQKKQSLEGSHPISGVRKNHRYDKTLQSTALGLPKKRKMTNFFGSETEEEFVDGLQGRVFGVEHSMRWNQVKRWADLFMILMPSLYLSSL